MWYKVRVAYERQIVDADFGRKMRETYLVEASSVTDAEDRMRTYIKPYVPEGCPIDIKGVAEENISLVIPTPLEHVDLEWYKARVGFLVFSEVTGKERLCRKTILVQGVDLSGALRRLEEVQSGSVVGSVICSISETTIVDVIALKPAEV